MVQKILNFSKTDHAMFRQWERKIPNKLIYLALRNYSGGFLSQTLIQVKSQTLVKWGFRDKTDVDLFIKIDRNVIVTLFYCPTNDSENYLAKSKSLYFKHYIL